MSSLLRTTRGASSILRSRIIPTTTRPAAASSIIQCQQQQRNQATATASTTAGGSGVSSSSSSAPTHAVSAPMLADIEKRWDIMPPQEQAELWMALRDRMKGSWAQLTLNEKKASYWIAFGPHGPRARPHPEQSWKVFKGTMYALLASAVIFVAVRMVAKPAPKTMTKEWQELSNEYMKEQKIEPITGVSSEGYKGPGMVQSK